MARKTVDVKRVLEMSNKALANFDLQNRTFGEESAKGFRLGVIATLETVLHETGNYKGFQFTDPDRQHIGGYLIDNTYDPSIRTYY